MVTEVGEGHCELVLPHVHNLHSIEALEPCAMLDVISPPYDETNPCVYYSAIQCESSIL